MLNTNVNNILCRYSLAKAPVLHKIKSTKAVQLRIYYDSPLNIYFLRPLHRSCGHRFAGKRSGVAFRSLQNYKTATQQIALDVHPRVGRQFRRWYGWAEGSWVILMTMDRRFLVQTGDNGQKFSGSKPPVYQVTKSSRRIIKMQISGINAMNCDLASDLIVCLMLWNFLVLEFETMLQFL
jgi:hypothetical protein